MKILLKLLNLKEIKILNFRNLMHKNKLEISKSNFDVWHIIIFCFKFITSPKPISAFHLVDEANYLFVTLGTK